MHRRWDDLLADLKETAGGLSSASIGRVLHRLMLGGGVTGGSVARIDITNGSMLVRRTPLSPGTVSKVTNAMDKQGLLTPQPVEAGGRGGPIVPLVLGSDRWAIIGIHVGYHGHRLKELVGVLVRLNGEEIVSATETFDLNDSSDEERVQVDGVIKLVDRLLREASSEKGLQITTDSLLGVGLEVGGHVHDGVIVYATHAKRPTTQEVGPLLTELLPVPVMVENDANARAIHAFYRHQFECLDVALVEVFDEGVGGGLIVDGHIYRGGGGMAMEPGHLSVEYRPPSDVQGTIAKPSGRAGFDDPCSCDPQRYGHVDTLATLSRIAGELDEDDIEAAAREPNLVEDPPNPARQSPQAEAFKRAGTALGRGLAHVIDIANPSLLLLRLPAVLAAAGPQTSGAEYLAAVESEVNKAFSTGPRDARAGGQRLRVEAVDPRDVASEGARAAAVVVLNGLVEHAAGRDGCKHSFESDRPRRSAARSRRSPTSRPLTGRR